MPRPALEPAGADSRAALEAAGSDWQGPTVRWLPLIDPTMEDLDPSLAGPGVLPLFPLGAPAFYMPNMECELNIYEPRYRRLYNDILASGSRRFVVVGVHPDGDRVAEVGVVFYLTDLRDVSERTRNEVKYVCNHKVIGRVRLGRILNPSQWEEARTYLRVETAPLEDDDAAADEGGDAGSLAQLEAEVVSELEGVFRLHDQLQGQGDHRFMPSESVRHVNASRADVGGLWGLAALWGEYCEFLLMERDNLLDDDMNLLYWSHGQDEEDAVDGEDDDDDDEDDDGLDEDDDEGEEYEDDDFEYPSLEEIELDNLPPALRTQMRSLQEQYEEEVDGLVEEQQGLSQGLLQSTSHEQRLRLLLTAFRRERQRLATKRAMLAALREVERSA